MLSRLIILILLVGSTSAQASILFGPSVTYTTVKTTDQTGFAGGDSNTSALGADAKLGVLIEGTVLYIGGLYSYESTTGNSNTKMTGANYGPTIGLFDGAFALLGTYIMGGSRTYSAGSVDSKISNGTGFRVDMSYVAGLTGSIGVGPQLTYRDIKYTKSTPASGIETSNTFEESTLYPSIVFWFRF
jgi:hypothetical protein